MTVVAVLEAVDRAALEEEADGAACLVGFLAASAGFGSTAVAVGLQRLTSIQVQLAIGQESSGPSVDYHSAETEIVRP